MQLHVPVFFCFFFKFSFLSFFLRGGGERTYASLIFLSPVSFLSLHFVIIRALSLRNQQSRPARDNARSFHVIFILSFLYIVYKYSTLFQLELFITHKGSGQTALTLINTRISPISEHCVHLSSLTFLLGCHLVHNALVGAAWPSPRDSFLVLLTSIKHRDCSSDPISSSLGMSLGVSPGYKNDDSVFAHNRVHEWGRISGKWNKKYIRTLWWPIIYRTGNIDLGRLNKKKILDLNWRYKYSILWLWRKWIHRSPFADSYTSSTMHNTKYMIMRFLLWHWFQLIRFKLQ